MKLKKGDTVKIIVGKFKNKIGPISKISKDKKRCEIVSVMVVKKHRKKQPDGTGGKIENVPISIDISNVMYYDSEDKVISKIGIKLENDKRVRYLKNNNKLLS